MKCAVVAMCLGVALGFSMGGGVRAAETPEGAQVNAEALFSTNNVPELTLPLMVKSYGVDLGLSSTESEVRGLQLELLMASIGKMTGLQFNGGLAGAKNMGGFQSGLVAALAGDAWGLQLGGLVGSCTAGEMTGIQISPGWFTYARKVCGAQFGGEWCALALEDVDGLQCGGLAALAGGNVSGIQIGGTFSVVGNLEEDKKAGGTMTGLQFAGLSAISESMGGIQMSPVNLAVNVGGLQIAVVNLARDVRGIQLGVVNHATNLAGMQIGAVNHYEQGGAPWMPFVNVGF